MNNKTKIKKVVIKNNDKPDPIAQLFLPYELNVIAMSKNIHLDVPFIAIIWSDGDIHCGGASHSKLMIKKDSTCRPAFTLQQIVDWFRENHDMNIWIDCNNKNQWIWTINFMSKGDYIQSDDEQDLWFNSYHEALYNAIEHAFKLI